MATDSWSITDTSPQPLLTPSAAVDPTFQPIPGAQPTCAHAHTHQGRSEFLASRGQLWAAGPPGMFLSSAQGDRNPRIGLQLCSSQKCRARAWVAAHLSSRPTLLLPKDAPPADFPFDAAGSPDATRGATPARTRMASATCPTRILECPCLAIPECHRCERGAARGNSSLLQSPAAGVDSHAPADSGTDLALAGQK